MTVSPCPAGKLPWDQWLTFSDFIVEYGRKSENAGKLEAVIDIRTWPPAYGNGIRVIVRKILQKRSTVCTNKREKPWTYPCYRMSVSWSSTLGLYDATIHSSAHNMTNVQQFQEHLLRADSERPRHKRFGLTVGNIDDRKYHIGTKIGRSDARTPWTPYLCDSITTTKPTLPSENEKRELSSGHSAMDCKLIGIDFR